MNPSAWRLQSINKYNHFNSNTFSATYIPQNITNDFGSNLMNGPPPLKRWLWAYFRKSLGPFLSNLSWPLWNPRKKICTVYVGLPTFFFIRTRCFKFFNFWVFLHVLNLLIISASMFLCSLFPCQFGQNCDKMHLYCTNWLKLLPK